ncbi:MAG TPA: hypothetical protein VGN26_16850 [Armatimonadota bacterium]|jgi:hypothetical protein
MRDTPLTDEERDAMLETLAAKVVARRLETPAILFLEMHRPLNFLASQSLIVGMPFLAPLFGPDQVEAYSALLQDSANVDRLIDRIQCLVDER